MSEPPRGLHEALVTEALRSTLAQLSEARVGKTRALREAEAADRVALHVGRVVRGALKDVKAAQRVEVGARLACELIGQLCQALCESVPGLDVQSDVPVQPAEVLHAILARKPDGSPEVIQEPLIPLLDTTLLTNSPGEPRVGKQIETELDSADRVDVVMAFIRMSGVRPLLSALEKHRSAGRKLRVLTTTYTGSTQAKALDALHELGAEIRVSYDTSLDRLHAKAWLFHRESGYSTAYIGSSNLTYSAQETGIEWNVRVSGARNGDVVEKVSAVFESYWESGDFEPYQREVFLKRNEEQRSGPELVLSPLEIRPEPFQERLLEQLTLSRQQGHHRNLLVSATGTGKTVMAAVDYARLRAELPRTRLLFVAHRKEILQQSRATFAHALRDASFGELWVGGDRPDRFEHVFASVQSLNNNGLEHLDPKHFDVVIIDEFHHAAAPSYDALLQHIQPVELLGLTATPERSDGAPVLHWFDDRIAAELRLWDAIDQRRLTPFLYYGLHDGVDLRHVPWRRGRGYDDKALTGVLTADKRQAHLVLKQLEAHVDEVSKIRALGFCVSVDHARFMAQVFRDAGVAATAVWGDSSKADRETALRELSEGKIQVLFSVDLFNEGVDLPTVDTLLMLRPTDSPTLFIQQLGRGLRRSNGKVACTVLDFIGQHRREFRMDRRLRALFGGSRKHLIEQVEGGFPFLPAGCQMQLDAVASEVVLRTIKNAIPSLFREKAAELARLAAESPNGDLSLVQYLEQACVELDDVYAGNRGWSDLREEAGLALQAAGPFEKQLRRATGRLLHLDDPLRIETYREFLSRPQPPRESTLAERDRRLLRMLIGSLVEKVVKKNASLDEGAAILWQHPQVIAELRDVLSVLESQVSHVQAELTAQPNIPLRVHARYTRREILAAFGSGSGARIAPWQTGVQWIDESQADVFAFTLDKTSGSFSPTTRYDDYAISRELIHWQSQSVTRADSDTGLRYQQHAERGTSVMLFARLRTDERAFWFLGPATYVSHSGERPMSVRWRLHHRLPGDLYNQFAAAVA
ncbi:MAG: DUF3427 domain-containing protein [Planctomycetes bacterium]|nr:DUF3427 domain-containing protein [Planctomycetota bacterium]